MHVADQEFFVASLEAGVPLKPPQELLPKLVAAHFLAVLEEQAHLGWVIDFDDDDGDDDDDDDKDDLELSCTPDTGPATLGQPYLCTCTASGGDEPYTIVLDPKHDTLPAGLTFTFGVGDVSATIIGTPTTAGKYAMYKVYAIDSGGGYDDHEFAAGTIASSSDLESPDAGAYTLFASLAAAPAALNPAQTRYVEHALITQDPATGKAPTAEQNPFASVLSPEEIATADNAIRSWLRLSDEEVWEHLSIALSDPGNTLSRSLQVKLLQLCKQAMSQTETGVKSIEAYYKDWSPSSRLALVKELTKTEDIAEMCTYMSTYRPSGRQRNPPFAAGVDALLIAITHKWPKL